MDQIDGQSFYKLKSRPQVGQEIPVKIPTYDIRAETEIRNEPKESPKKYQQEMYENISSVIKDLQKRWWLMLSRYAEKPKVFLERLPEILEYTEKLRNIFDEVDEQDEELQRNGKARTGPRDAGRTSGQDEMSTLSSYPKITQFPGESSHACSETDTTKPDVFHEVFKYLRSNNLLQSCQYILRPSDTEVDIQAKDEEERVCLERRIKSDNPGFVENVRLRSIPKDITAGEIPEAEPGLHEAIRQRDYEKLKKLISIEDVNAYSSEGLTPLMIAAGVEGDIVSIWTLLKGGANVMLQGGTQNETAAHLASGRGLIDVVRMLLNNRPEVMLVKDSKGMAPIHWAAKMGHWDCCFLLVDTYQALYQDLPKAGELYSVCSDDSPSRNSVQLMEACPGLTSPSVPENSHQVVEEDETDAALAGPSIQDKLEEAQTEFARFLNERGYQGCNGIQGFYVDEQPELEPCLVIDADSSKQEKAEEIIQEFLQTSRGIISRNNIQILGQTTEIQPAHGAGSQLLVERVNGEDRERNGIIGSVVQSKPDGSQHVDPDWSSESSVAVTCCHLFTDDPKACEGTLEGQIVTGADVDRTRCRFKGILGYHTMQPVEYPHKPRAAVDIALIKLENNNELNVDQYEGYVSSGNLYFKDLQPGDRRKLVNLAHAQPNICGLVFSRNYCSFNEYTNLYENELLVIHPADQGRPFATEGDSGSFVVLERNRSMAVGIVTYVRANASVRGEARRINQTFAAYLKNCIDILRRTYHIRLNIPSDRPEGDELEVEQLPQQ